MTYLGGLKALTNHKENSNHAADLMPQECTPFDFDYPDLVSLKATE